MSIKYEIILYWSEEDEAYIAEVPELPGCMADGKTYEEALKNAEVIIEEWLKTAEELVHRGLIHYDERIRRFNNRRVDFGIAYGKMAMSGAASDLGAVRREKGHLVALHHHRPGKQFAQHKYALAACTRHYDLFSHSSCRCQSLNTPSGNSTSSTSLMYFRASTGDFLQ